MAVSAKTVKVWRATKAANAGVMIDQTFASLIGNKNNFVTAHSGGVAIFGNSITLGTTSENIRVGGLFVNMNDFVKMIPQTLVTPMPSQVPFPPFGFFTGIVKDMPFFLASLI